MPRSRAEPGAAVTSVTRTRAFSSFSLVGSAAPPRPQTANSVSAAEMAAVQTIAFFMRRLRPGDQDITPRPHAVPGATPCVNPNSTDTISCDAIARAGPRAGRREGYPPLSPYQGARQTRGPVRGQIPHRGFRAQQLHQLGHLFHLRAHPVPQPIALAALERGLAIRRPA